MGSSLGLGTLGYRVCKGAVAFGSLEVRDFEVSA